MEELSTDDKLLLNNLDEQIAKQTCISQQKNSSTGIKKVKKEVKELDDDFYCFVSDPLKVEIKDESENNFIQASAAESYTTNVGDPDIDDQDILTAEGHPTSENSTAVPELHKQHGEEITGHYERNQSVTTIKKTHFCKVCNRAFSHPSHLATHECTHTSDKECSNAETVVLHSRTKPNICSVCHKGFRFPSELKKHERTHTGEKPYVCNVCQKAYRQIAHLRTHKLSHSEDKPYVCSVCLRTFSSYSKLASHAPYHSGDRPHVCDVCNKAFSEASYLVLHRRIHTGERPYVCNVCQMAFRQTGHLRTHKNRIHPGNE